MEEWKPAFGHEGRYEVSSEGRIRTVARVFTRDDGKQYTVSARYRSTYLNKHGYLFVALVTKGKPKTMSVARLIALSFGIISEGDLVDHINVVKTDNRTVNLRAATVAQNNQNSKINVRNTSGHKGVSFNKRAGKWKSAIKHNGSCTFLGYFDSAEAAKTAYDSAAKIYHGQFARSA